MRSSPAPNFAAVVALGILLILGGGCSVKKFAVWQLADALAGQGEVYASDDDPELIRQALPFSLKLMESVLAESPEHEGLLLSTSSGFTQYAYGFIVQDADRVEPTDIAKALALRDRARKLLLRARDYGLRGLEAKHPGFTAALRSRESEALESMTPADVPLLYWTAAAWGAAISVSKSDQTLVADQIPVQALIDRALELDESFSNGAIHAFLISYEPARQGASRPWEERSREHFRRAVELSGGLMAGPYVTLAEVVSIQKQDRAEFESLLNQALAIDVDQKPQWRLANLIMQERARMLLSRKDELFLE